MQSLREFQQSFFHALEDRQQVGNLTGITAQRFGVDRQFQVYRNNMRYSLADSLGATYPAIKALVGDEFFNWLAGQYLSQHPSRSGDLHEFGGHLSETLEQMEEVNKLPYLADLARLEWHYHEVFHEADANPIGIEVLAGVPQDQLGELRLTLHPATRLLQSDYPLLDIWNLAIHRTSEDQAIDLQSGGESLAVTRRNLEMQFHRVDENVYRFMQLVQEERRLHEIFSELSGFEEKNIQNWIGQLFQLGSVVSYSI